MVEASIRDTALSRRCHKGIAFAREGRVKRCGDLFIVNGETGNYTVCLNHQTYQETCSCKDWKINVLERGNQDHRCKHIYAVTLFEARCRS